MHGYTQTGKIGELLKWNRLFLDRGLSHILNIGELNFRACLLYINLSGTKRPSNNSTNSIFHRRLYYIYVYDHSS